MSTKKHTACTAGYVGHEQLRSKVSTELFKTHKRADGLARKTKPKASLAGKSKVKNKNKGNNTARKGSKDFTNWRSTTTPKTQNQSRLHRTDGYELGSRRQLDGCRLVIKRMEHRFVELPCVGTSGTTVATDAAGLRTVQSNAWRKYFECLVV